jgi:hypothetical protein
MKSNEFRSKSLMKVLACTAVALGAICFAQAQDKAVDPSGTWTWTGGRGGPGGPGGGGPGGGGGGRRGGGGTNVLVLKFTDGKLTGTLTAPARRGGPGGGGGADAGAAPPPPTKTDITEGKVTGDKISFKIVRTMGDNEITIPYSGTISNDTITGTMTMPGFGGGDPMERPWTATKQK